MNAPTAGKQIVDRAIRAASCDTYTSSFSVSSEGSTISTKGPSNASPTRGLNLIGQSHPGGDSLDVAQGLGEITCSITGCCSVPSAIHHGRFICSDTPSNIF